MANTDFPRGFYSARSETGGAPRVGKYKNTAAAVYIGDVVKKDGSGRILTITAVTDVPFGVAKNYRDATGGEFVYVYDDLENTTFEVQVDDNSITDDTDVGNFFDVAAIVTGDTTRLTSKLELDGNASVRDTLTLYSMITRPDNDDALANNKVRVKVRVDSQVSQKAIEA